LKQTTQILLGLRAHVTGPQAKGRRKFLAISQESRSQLFQGRWGIAFLLPITNLPGEA
jgi:hypothetical protein